MSSTQIYDVKVETPRQKVGMDFKDDSYDAQISKSGGKYLQMIIGRNPREPQKVPRRLPGESQVSSSWSHVHGP